MKEREKMVMTELVGLLLILWLGFLVHRSPRFAGSLAGGLLGVAGALLMLLSMAHMIVKRIPALKRYATARISMRALLVIHVHAGVLGAIFGLLHTGHKFDSHLGVTLTAVMMIVVLSGFIGRYLLRQSSESIQEKREVLTNLELTFRQTARQLASASQGTTFLPRPGLTDLLSFWRFSASAATPLAVQATQLAESIADVEYAIRNHETFKRAFAVWLKIHIAFSFTLLLVLGLHIWSALHFGLRWFA